MRLYSYFIFLLCGLIAMLYVSKHLFRGSAQSAIGIAVSKDHKITTERPTLIEMVRVIEGQQVKQYDTLVQLSSRELEADLERTINKLGALKREYGDKTNLLNAQIHFLQAQAKLEVADIESQIQALANEVQLHRSFVTRFSTMTDSLNSWPSVVKLKSLREEKNLQEQAMAIKIKNITEEKNIEQELVLNQIQAVSHELRLLQEDKRKLVKCATQDGVIENVYVKKGEEVDAYSPLLSISPDKPTSVIAYLTGKKNPPAVGSMVQVIPFARNSAGASGKVIGYGAVVALPELLQVSTAVRAFGREVFIVLDASNHFASGEKVIIQ